MDQYKHINLSYLYEIADNEDSFVKELISDYIVNVPQQLNSLKQAVTDVNMEQMEFISHKMKSSFQFLGADRMIELATLIEKSGREKQYEMAKAGTEELVTLMPQLLAELQHKLNLLN